MDKVALMFLKILQFQIQSTCGESLWTTTGTESDPLKVFSLNFPQTLCHRITTSILHRDTEAQSSVIGKSHKAGERLDLNPNSLMSELGLYHNLLRYIEFDKFCFFI